MFSPPNPDKPEPIFSFHSGRNFIWFFSHLVGKKGSRIPGFKGSSEILKRKQNLQRKTLEPLNPQPLMFLALHLTPGILDPLTPDVFTHSFGDDPFIYKLLQTELRERLSQIL